MRRSATCASRRLRAPLWLHRGRWLSAWCGLGLGLGLSACNGHLGHWEGAEPSTPPETLDAGQLVAGHLGAALPPVQSHLQDASASSAGSSGSGQTGTACQSELPTRSCELAPGVRLPDDATAEPLGLTDYFADGAVLPPGRYRIAYVDGCMRFDLSALGADLGGLFGWTIHTSVSDTTTGAGACWLIGDNDTLLQPTPGTQGLLIGLAPYPAGGAYASYGECVAGNCLLPADEFPFAGGKLGVRYGSGQTLTPVVVSGIGQGGRAPTFRLTRLDPCP